MPSLVQRRVAAVVATALTAAGLATVTAAPAAAAPGGALLYGLTTDNRLVSFRAQTPGTLVTDAAITGLGGVDLVGIDVRPATGQLYAVGANSRLYVLDPGTAAATLVGAAVTPALSGTAFGVDFNPVPDRLRIVSDAEQNLRVNPVTGGAANVDGTLAYAPTDANPLDVVSAAYTNSDADTATGTTLYYVDSARDQLVTTGNPNGGVLTAVGALGVDTTSAAGLDIDVASGTAYGLLTVGGVAGLYTVNLTTGAATLVGATSPGVEDVTTATPRVGADSVTVAEGGTATVTIRRTGDVADPASVTFALGGGTATANVDYDAITGAASFAAGQTTTTFTVPTTADLATEGTETATITVTSTTAGSFATAPATLSITDASSGLAYALTAANEIVTFSLGAPGSFSLVKGITGLATGEDVLGIDVRPATGELYALGSTRQLYVVDPTTGTATARGAQLSPAFTGTAFGVDFNPVPDRLRVVSDAEENFRFNPVTGGPSAITPPAPASDGPIAYAAGDVAVGANPNLVGAGYTNSVAGATATTLYTVDSVRNQLNTQSPPNNGTQNTVGLLGVDITDGGDLDIAPAGNAAFGAFTPATAGGTATLYRIDLTTGAATSLGIFADGTTEDIAIASSGVLAAPATATVAEGAGSVDVTVTRTGSTNGTVTVAYTTAPGGATAGSDYTTTSGTLTFADGETSKTITVPVLQDVAVEGSETFTVTLSNPQGGAGVPAATATTTVTVTDDDTGLAYALTTANAIVTFDVRTPGTAASTFPITGLAAGEDVLGIDVRPATGELYALGSTRQLYVVDPTTGVATARGAALSPAFTGTAFGVDFNPVPDRLRVVSDTEENFRFNPVTGGASSVTPPAPASDGPIAYAAGDAAAGADPNLVGAGYTNNVPGATTTTLYTVDSVRNQLNTQVPPNNGTQNTVGPLGVDITDGGDLDITSFGGAAFGAFTPASGGVATLYRVDLATGTLRPLGAFADPATEDLALSTVPSVTFASATVTVAEGGTSALVEVVRPGSKRGAVTVDYTTNEGLARAGSDYTTTSGTLSFADGESSKVIVVPVLQDGAAEGPESFTVTLSNPTGAVTVAPTTTTVTITDDDAGNAYGLTSGNRIVTFDVITPGATPTADLAIRGLAPGEDLLGLDVRPATGGLYAISDRGGIFLVDPTTGDAQRISTSSTLPSGTSFGVDFNPVPDRLRVVSNTGQNLRINVDTGAALVDGTLVYGPGDVTGIPAVGAAAYTNSVAGATTTTLYDVDATGDRLAIQNPPNDGVLTAVGPLGLDANDLAGLDISAQGDNAYAVLTTTATGTMLYRIDLRTGAATSRGLLARGDLEDLALTTAPVARAGRFHPVTPTRVLDTRSTAGNTVQAGVDRSVVLLGKGGIPATGVSAVAVNVTVLRGSAKGYLTAYPSGAPRPRTSNLNYQAGQNVSALVQAGLGVDGAIALGINTGTAEVIVDVLGWYGDAADTTGTGYSPVEAARASSGRLVAGADRTVRLAGVVGVPSGAKAVAVNVTVAGATAPLDVQLYPGGTPGTPRTTTVSAVPGQTVANAAIAVLGADGTVRLRVPTGAADVFVDVIGYYGATGAGRFVPVVPVRVLDTRSSGGALTLPGDRAVPLAGVGPVPAGALAAVVNLTSTATTDPLFVTVYPTGRPPVNRTSTFNPVPGREVANSTTAALGAPGSASLRVSRPATHVLVDVLGYVLPS